MAIIDDLDGVLDRVDRLISRAAARPRSGAGTDSPRNIFLKLLVYLKDIAEKPVPVQVGIGTSAGCIPGISEMNQNWEYAANLFAATKPYLRYILFPAGLYAANRLLCSLVPGPEHLPKLDLHDRTVLITGASSGLGRELAFSFYRRGAKELCDELKALPDVQNTNEPIYKYLDISDPNGFDELISLASTRRIDILNTNEPIYKYLDISDPNGFDELISLASTRRIDILVNNAGLSMRGSCKDTPMNVHRQIMEVNYFGHIAVTKALLDYIPSDGAILYISTEGKPMDKDDPNQAKGLTPSYAAERILNALVNRKTELVLAPLSYRFAIFLRWLFPNLFFYIMYRRGLNDESVKNK
ncbi:unnamed protein product [Gongylonema pulchrum]|uniref:Epimerase domain-containing protein n=1 Tax=Gongylonema pulchrum TaxID=637853 RepID=A0A183E5E4_9BILA|nr:unnamed protein product [Gongylonema pulchrum]